MTTKRDGQTFAEFWAQLSKDLPPRPYYVYRLYNAGGELIYVGKAASLRTRMCGHWHDSGWFMEVDRMEVDRFTTHEEAT